jgi:hypothetical protein
VLDTAGVVHPFGTATNFGNADSAALAPGERFETVVARPQRDGYWVVTDRGRVLPFGAAPALTELAGIRLVAPIVAGVASPTGNGLTLAASDGGVFAFGDAPFLGSMGGAPLVAPIVSIAAYGLGYRMTGSDGGTFIFSELSFWGRAVGPVVD